MIRQLWVIAAAFPAFLLMGADIPPHAARGEEIFFKTAQPAPCGTCHTLAGKGTAVGPDLKRWAGFSPRMVAVAIRSTVTVNVVTVEPKTGSSFAAIKAPDQEKFVRYWDLEQMPPVLRNFEAAEIKSVAPNVTWKHPPGDKFTLEQMADLVGYIRFAVNNRTTPLNPADVQ